MKSSWWIFFYKCLFSRRSNAVVRRVSWICLLGLIISIASLVIIFNVMGGLGKSIREQFLSEEPHVVLTLASSSNPVEQENKINNILQSQKLDQGISDFYFFETVDVVIQTSEGVFSGAVARGYDAEHLKSLLSSMLHVENMFPKKVENADSKTSDQLPAVHIKKQLVGEQSLFVVESSKNTQKIISLGMGLAMGLNVYEGDSVNLIPAENLLLPVGEPLRFESVQVGQIVSAQSGVHNDRSLFYDRHQLSHFSKMSSYLSGFEIRLKNPYDYMIYQNKLKQAGFIVESWPERNSSVFFALKVEKTVMSLFLSLAGCITLLAVSSLLALLIVQKKREIGALMAMGLSLQKVRQLFIGMGMGLCTIGVVGGILGGLLGCLFLMHSPIPIPFLAPLYQLEGGLPIEIRWSFLAMLGSGFLLFASINCWLSVRFHLQFSPAELLKTNNR